MGTLVDVKNAADAIKTMLEILKQLTPDKAVVLEVQNLTEAPLRLVSHEHTEGGFAEPPSPVIGPGQADIFGSKDDGPASGTKGRVSYESEAGFLLNIVWANPFGPGDPDSSSSVVGDKAAFFEVTDIAGVGNTAKMQYVVRPGVSPGLIVRKGTVEAGRVSEIASIKSGPRQLLTAVRTGSNELKLIQWGLGDDGSITRVADSAAAAGEASSIDIARGKLFVTACRSGSGNLLLISWEVGPAGAISRRGDSRNAAGDDRAGDSQNVRIAALSETLFVTAIRSASRKLMLITWRLDVNNELIRVSDSGEQAGEVSEISLLKASPDQSGNHRVVTSLRGGGGKLVMISWSVAPDGTSIRRLSFNQGQAGGAKIIRSVMTAPNRMATSVQRDNGTLLVISWSLDSNGTITRLGDGTGQAGRITDNALMSRPDGVLSAVHGVDGLRLIKWQISPQGAVKRIADSGEQAGETEIITLTQDALDGVAPIVAAVATSDHNLKLISWSDGGG